MHKIAINNSYFNQYLHSLPDLIREWETMKKHVADAFNLPLLDIPYVIAKDDTISISIPNDYYIEILTTSNIDVVDIVNNLINAYPNLFKKENNNE